MRQIELTVSPRPSGCGVILDGQAVPARAVTVRADANQPSTTVEMTVIYSGEPVTIKGFLVDDPDDALAQMKADMESLEKRARRAATYTWWSMDVIDDTTLCDATKLARLRFGADAYLRSVTSGEPLDPSTLEAISPSARSE